MKNEIYGCCLIVKSWNFFICGLIGKIYGVIEQYNCIEFFVRVLFKVMGWELNVDLLWDKVIVVFFVNIVSK